MAPLPAAASGAHAARLSADLSDHLAAGSQAFDVIVHGTRAEVDALAARYNLRVAKYLASGACCRSTPASLAAIQQDETRIICRATSGFSRRSPPPTSRASAPIRCGAARTTCAAQTGSGVTVAVIDSGINVKHNALKGRVLATRDFTGGDGRIITGTARTSRRSSPARRARRRAEGLPRHRAGRVLLNLRVLGDDGSGTVSDVIEAIDWTIEHRHEYNVRIIDLSLGAPVLQPYRDDPLCEAVERAVRAGLVVVAAAGQFRARPTTANRCMGAITSPANSPYAIAVGAIDTHDTAARSDDTVASYSSRGPTATT